MQCSCSITPSESEKDPDVAKIINYQVKFCWIPTQAATVTRSNKSVQSIEEIVNELNTILTALKQSGELTKRNETQELLDTSLENKDMAKSFVFSLNVSSKPAGNSGNDEEILQKTLDEAAKQNRETIRGTSNEISTIQKNKYVVISNVALNTTSKQAADTTEDKLNNSNIVQDLLNAQIPIEQIKENSQQDAIITQSNVHTSNTALFLRDSIKFWEQVTGFVELQQDISLILKNKIEAAQ